MSCQHTIITGVDFDGFDPPDYYAAVFEFSESGQTLAIDIK